MDRSGDVPPASVGSQGALSHPIPAVEAASRIVQRGRRALNLLVESYECAEELNRTVWDFAVEIGGLRKLGLTISDFRWLVCKGYVEHAIEITFPGEAGRAFQGSGGLAFKRRTCFVLTESGLAFARKGCGLTGIVRESSTGGNRRPTADLN